MSETWFIPFDITMICCQIVAIVFAMLFLIIIVCDKTCNTIPMMLVGNSCLTLLAFAISVLWMTIVTLNNDLRQIIHVDTLCAFRGYLSYGSVAAMNHSFLLQAIYRYVTAVNPNRVSWRSARTQLSLICITWIVAFLYPVASLFTGDIVFNLNNQVCQIPLRLSFPLLFMIFTAYMLPVTMIQVLYFKLVRYVTAMNKRVVIGNNLSRAHRELKMVRRILSMVTILVVAGIPYTIFIFISFVTEPPKYHFRIASAFVNASIVVVIMTLFLLTDPLKLSLMRKMKLRANVIMPTMGSINIEMRT